MSIGTMKDEKLKLKNLHVSQTLGWSWNWKTYMSVGVCVVVYFQQNKKGDKTKGKMVVYYKSKVRTKESI